MGKPDHQEAESGSEDYSQQPFDEAAEEMFQAQLATSALTNPVSNDQEYDEGERRDLELSIALLAGAWTQQGADPMNKKADRAPAKRYIEGNAEKLARQAIGRLLRCKKPLDSHIRNQLAELFDGEPPHSLFESVPMERRLTFVGKSQGPTDVTLRDLHMVSDYYLELNKAGGVHKRARQAICKKYNISDTVLKEARRKFPSLARNQHLEPEGGQ